MKAPSLSKLLEKGRFPQAGNGKQDDKALEHLQLQMLRAQQGIWHSQGRAVILFEGFDAAGKGGAIHRLVDMLDPRGFRVHPIGPPESNEKGQHYLQRFWARLPNPGLISIFDRSWYGRVLVERVEKLTPAPRLNDAYEEIVEFENLLLQDGIDLVKIFLAIDKHEQLKRFEDRLKDPYKQWKLTDADVEGRAKWDAYVEAADRMFKKTHTAKAPWHLIPANDKHYARSATLELVTSRFGKHSRWMESRAHEMKILTLEAALRKLGQSKV
jgi:polyphosphate kinase 2 (PPK2 family)